MNLNNFIVEEGVLGVVIGTIIGFGTTNFIKSLREAFIEPLILNNIKRMKYFNPTTGKLIASIIEFLILLLIIYLIYILLVVPLFSKELEEKKEDKKEDDRWQQKVAKSLEDINRKTRWIW